MQNWFTALFGPIFTKEMIELARRRRTFVLRVVYGLALLFALILALPMRRITTGGAIDINRMAWLAGKMFTYVAVLQNAAIYLLVPMFLCGVVASERENHSLETLFTTPLQDREIVLGKLFSRLAVVGLLILTGLPIFGFMMLWGGIEPLGIGRLAFATASGALFAGAHAIYFSTTSKSPLGALVQTYWRLSLWIIGPVVLIQGIIETLMALWPALPPTGRYGRVCLCIFDPAGSVLLAVDPEMRAEFVAFLGAWYFPFTMAMPLAVSLFMLWRAKCRLRIEPTRKPGLISRVASLTQGVLRRLLPRRGREHAAFQALGAPSRLLESPPTHWLWLVPVRNPLWLRARQARCFDREGHLARVQWGVWFAFVVFVSWVVMIAVIGYFEHRDDGSFRIRMFRRYQASQYLLAAWAAATVLTMIVAPISIVGDRRRGFFDLVLATPLSGRDIIGGSLAAIWQHLWPIYLLPLALSAMFLVVSTINPLALLGVLITVYLFLSVLMIFGLACSLCARSVAGALVPTLIFVCASTFVWQMVESFYLRHAVFILWFVSGVGLIAGSFWVRRRVVVASVACYLLAAYQCAVAAATCWVEPTAQNKYGVEPAMPFSLAFSVLDDRGGFDRFGQYRPLWEFDRTNLTWALVCHWLATILFCLWARRWLIAHFDALVQRSARPARQPGRLATVLQETVYFFYWRIPEALRKRVFR